MTPAEAAQWDKSQYLKALARWEDEGGALNFYASRENAERVKAPHAALNRQHPFVDVLFADIAESGKVLDVDEVAQ